MADSLNIQWFPGHMTKTRRMIEANLKQVDAVMEIVDARIPVSSRNPLIDELTKGKKRLIVLNKCDLSQPEGNRLWSDYFSARGYAELQLNALSGKGVSAIAPALRPLLKETGELVCLVKPQFEAGREKVGKKGVVRDKAVHREVLEQFLRHAAESQFFVKDLTFSPIRGPEGNIEYLGHLTVAEQPPYTGDLAALVEASHARLEGKEP